MSCKNDLNDVQETLLSVLFEKQLKASQNNLESARLWQKTAKFFFFGMVFAFCLSIMLAVGYFYFYDFTYEVVEEEIITHSEDIYQSTGDNVIDSSIKQNMTIGGE